MKSNFKKTILLKSFTLLVITFFICLSTQGATRYTVVSGNWNDSTTWSATSGGTAGASVPIAGDSVIISNTVTITADAECISLTLISGTLSLGTNQLTVKGRIIQTSGNIDGSGGTVVLSGTTAQTIPSATFLNNTLKNLTINNSAGVTLSDTLKLTGTHTSTPTSGTLNTGGHLRLVSTATTTANIANGNCSTCSYISGNVAVERYIPTGLRRYRFLSSPIVSTTLADWQNEMYITGPGIGNLVGTKNTNGFDATAGNFSSSFYYDELTAAWLSPTDTSQVLAIGKGYRIAIRGDRSDSTILTSGTIGSSQNAVTLDLKGIVNQGNITMPVSYSSSTGLGWCLLGNPYPSAYDFQSYYVAGNTGGIDSSGTNYSNIGNTIFIYSPTSGGYHSYNASSNTGTSYLNSGIIPSGSAFWVRATAVSPSLIFTEAYKVSTNAGAGLFKKSGGNFSITLIMDSLNSDEMVVKYMSAATLEVDNYDMIKMFGGDINIASITPSGKLLTGNCKPFNGVSDTIPLFMSVKKLVKYTLKFKNVVDLAAGKTIELFDSVTGNRIDLTKDSEYIYTPNATEKLSRITRFKILVGCSKNTGFEDITKAITPRLKFKVYPTVTSSTVSINASIDNNEKNTITITDITGKTLYKTVDVISKNQPKEIDLSGYQNGIYLITVLETAKGTQQTFKVVKTN